MHRRQVTLFDLPKPKYVTFGIKKVGKRRWKIVKHSAVPDSFKIQISKTLYTSQKAHVFSLGLNEIYGEFHFERVAKFSKKQWARDFMYNGRMDCRDGVYCGHNRQCRQRKIPSSNLSPYWQHTYFFLYNKKIEFLPYTETNGKRCCQIG